MKQHLRDGFLKAFGDLNDVSLFFAPGRVNLIGEHTDYNGGHVFPCALTLGTYAAARKNGTDQIHVYSENCSDAGMVTANISNLRYDERQDFANYPFGVLHILQTMGYEFPQGMDIFYYGNLPHSSGLSSSASIEVLTAYLASELFGFSLSFIDIAKICQRAENEFVGVNCGIMDQFAIAMGKKDKAIFLDTATLDYRYANLDLGDMRLVIASSNKKRGLNDSKYNQRRQECEEALSYIKQELPVNSLGDMSIEEFEAHKHLIPAAMLVRRAKHAVYENQRTIQAVEALEKNDFVEFGKLMIQSHESLRDDYEVTGIELDTLVSEALKCEGVLGSRMTGAGFGGCTVTLVHKDHAQNMIETVGSAYLDKIGYAADFYIVTAGSGPCCLA